MDNIKRTRFSKDPITFQFDATDFFKIHEWFFNKDSKKFHLLDEERNLEIYEKYYKFTSKYLVCLFVGVKLTNFGQSERPKIEFIQVVERDGSEIDILKTKIKSLYAHHANPDRIKAIEKVIALIPPYESQVVPREQKSFGDYVVDLGYKTFLKNLQKEYVVLDLETNGLREKYDDVLSISIYDPQNGLCYNRFLPLDYQPVVLTTRINGIKQEDVESCGHITQEELDELISTFKLKERIILVYSGGNGTFDSSFLCNYCARHKLCGIEGLQYENIKDYTPYLGMGYEGMRTKDNLCKLFGIEGVTDIHSGANDCLLEWKLFEAIKVTRPFFKNGYLFSFSDEYIVPITMLLAEPQLGMYKGIERRFIVGVPSLVYQYNFPEDVSERLKRFPNNITGIALENAIYGLISPEKQDNCAFLLENKKKCQCIGYLKSNREEIPIATLDDGTIKSLDFHHDAFIDEVNAVSRLFAENIGDTIGFIKHKIFCDVPIKKEELIISEDKKVLAICDLSSDKTVLEIKTGNVLFHSPRLDYEYIIVPGYSQQLYYETNGRSPFIMSIVFDVFGKVTINIYSVELLDMTEEAKGKRPKLMDREQKIIELIKENERISIPKMSRHLHVSGITIQRTLEFLRRWGYVKREGSKTAGRWVIIPDET